VSAEVLAPVLAAGTALLLGNAVAVGERHRLLVRSGVEVSVPSGPSFIARVRARVRPAGGVGRRPVLLQLVLGSTGLLLGLATAGLAGAVAGLAVGVWLPRWRGSRRATRHAALVEAQLADAMDGIAAALRAGMSPSQAIEFACEEGEPPLADGLRAVVRREALGMPLDDSLELLAREEGGDDVRLAVAVLQLQHRVGGDAPAVLDDAVRTLRQRVGAAAELRSLTAQARLSGAILGLLPIGFFLFMSVVSRSEVSNALASPIGLASVVFGLVLDGLAFLWIRHLLRSEG
jgi:tight adherence protein B